MKVFLSWSGERSRLAAEALRKWLPDVIQNIEPWMSAADIDAGARWNRLIEDELSNTQVGILCLTGENQEMPWVLFEAGALAKTISDTLVCPYLIGFSAADLKAGPLTRFQAKEANEDGTWELLLTLNRALKEHALTDERLRRIFDRFWPDLNRVLANLPQPRENPARRPVEDMVDEILKLVRGLARRAPSLSAAEVLAARSLAEASWSSDDPSTAELMRYFLDQQGAALPSRTLFGLTKKVAQKGLFDVTLGKVGSKETDRTETPASSEPTKPE